MLYSTRSKLIVSFAGLSFLVCGVALLVGGQLLYGAFLNEAANRVRSDLNAAREIYLARVKGLRVALSITALGPAFRSAIGKKDGRRVVDLLREVARQSELDFAGMVTRDGKRFCHIGPDAVSNEAYPPNPIADLALKHHTPVAGTLMLSQEFLASEDPGLANRARMKLFPTRRSAPQTETEETLGMALSAAVPVFEGENLLGVLYGGVLLNRSREIVDQVCNTVFQQETYKGRTIGTAALFFRDIRISTNFLSSDGTRALGTLASEEVERRVLTEGKTWTDRAFVVSDWYITAYEPIEDVFGQRVGMLGIGVLEAKYADVRSKALSVFIFITVAGMACAVGLGYIIADKISRPVHQLIEASLQVTQGNLSPEMGPVSRSEIGVLQKTFKKMLVSFEERDERLKKESEIKLFQSEKQAT
ncbi:MAG: HAMP domain-containing protein, partial [Deltaproteobacteria bacterium]